VVAIVRGDDSGADSDGDGSDSEAVPAAAAVVPVATSILPTDASASEALPRGHGSNIPQRLWSSLYPFQREGVVFGLRVAGRVLIGDEMGLGKTLQGLALAAAYRHQWPCLILAPASMCLQWADELEKWLPWLLPTDVNLVLSRDNSRLDNAPISIMSYGMMTSGKAKEALAKRISDANFQVVVADEAHYLKNAASARAKLILPVLQAASRTILLTGTPALNCPQELFSLVNTLDEVTFPDWSAYAERYCDRKLIFVAGGRRSWDTRGASNLPELHQKLST
jgi:SNF2 family DNA or RNA helicase